MNNVYLLVIGLNRICFQNILTQQYEVKVFFAVNILEHVITWIDFIILIILAYINFDHHLSVYRNGSFY